MRDTIFIGHANPEDDEKTMWLYSKLKNEGYNVECDLTYLIGGEEDYWKSLQTFLEERTAKYVLIFTEHSFQKQGVIDEWEFLKGVARRHSLKDFVMVLKFDEVPFDARIGANTKNQFRFDKSWASGMRSLFRKLDKDSVPRPNSKNLSLNDWLKNTHSAGSGVIERNEKFYSNWLEIKGLPEQIYFYRFLTETQAATIEEEYNDYPCFRLENHLITFSARIPTYSIKNNMEIEYKERISIPTSKFFQKYEGEEFPKYVDLKRIAVRLLKKSVFNFLDEKDIAHHMFSRKTRCYYYKKDQVPDDKVHFEYEGKKTWKQLIGEYKTEHFWHYGISFDIMFYPFFCYNLKAHLLFSDDGENIWNGKRKIFSARRNKGKTFFNKEWRSLMLGMINSLVDENGQIKIPIAEGLFLIMDNSTICFTSTLGYIEPKGDARLVPLDYRDEEEEEVEEDIEEGEELEIEENEDTEHI